jgi:23S rRNA-/tRNA-specific pseudouridylate synthase
VNDAVGALPIAFRGVGEVVIVKPAGISSEAPGAAAEDTALGRVRRAERWPDARLPHRLDRLTRGFLLVARDSAAAAFHSDAIRAGRWEKFYLARLVAPRGVDPAALVGLHRRYLRREGRVARVVRSGGDPSALEILAVAAAPGHAGAIHAAIRLLTGRYHQIRVMCADLGAPLVGDDVYGGGGGDGGGGSPYLEHAAFRFNATDGARVELFNAQDPLREPAAPSVLAAFGPSKSANT